MKENPNPLAELIKARLREFWREPGIVFWVFGFPLLMALGLGLAFRSKTPEKPLVALVRVDQSPASDKLARALVQSDQLKAELYADQASAFRALTRARVDVVAELSESGVRYRYDPTQDKSPHAQLLADDVLQEASGRTRPLASERTVVSEPGSRYIDFLLPGLIGMNLMGSSMWGVGYNLVVARKRKLLRRYAVTPMKRSHFLLSYFISRSLFLVLELGALLAFGALIFGCELQGSLLAFCVVAFAGAASFAGISLLIGARVENTESANGWMNLIQLPMWVLGGTFFSYERFPEFLHLPIELLPLTALINGLRAIYNDGIGLMSLGFPLAVLAVWGGAGYLLALRSFKWQ